jgi:trk system potassium uptake protein TrkH
MTIRGRILKIPPASFVVASFLTAITLGTMLLKLPVATNAGFISWPDALFTATSAVCVTGLIVVDTGSYFSTFGQLVILGLIQIGGLGVMTISVVLFRWIGLAISYTQRSIMQNLFTHTPRADIFALIRSVLLFTVVAEAAGFALFAKHWIQQKPLGEALYTSLFHSISAFCNAGFSLYANSMMDYSENILLNLTMVSLIVAGGIGFPVLHEFYVWMKRRHTERVRLSVHFKTVLITTAILIVGGAVMFAFLEWESLSAAHSPGDIVLVSLFQSVTCRTAGFNTVDIGSLNEATLAMMIVLMFIGASPGSCGGGIKTTALALLVAFTYSRVKRFDRANMFHKSIPKDTVTRTVSLVLVSLGAISVVFFMILAGDLEAVRATMTGNGVFLACLFETASAFGTVGLSMGVTSALGLWGKYWIIGMMFLGRVGVIAFAYIVVGAGTPRGIEYSEENIMIG